MILNVWVKEIWGIFRIIIQSTVELVVRKRLQNVQEKIYFDKFSHRVV